MKILSHRFPILYIFLGVLYSCAPAEKKEKEEIVHTKTPVKVSLVGMEPISESIELSANTSFIRKNEIRSTSNGYIQKILVQLGDPVKKGQTLFILKTKEANALGNNLFPNDTSLRFSGIIPIKARESGYLTNISHQIGDYLQEGDPLCSIVDQHSLVFMINVPFEWSKYVHLGLNCQIILPDGRKIQGTIFQKVSIMDIGSQTQSYMARANTSENFPENLIAKVRIYKENHLSTLSVEKSAVLTNEEESQFWVMKVIGDTMAIKIPITKGIENAERVEILGNALKSGDKVLISGNYGLPDSSSVVIEK